VPVVWCAAAVDTGEQTTFWGRDPRLGAWLDARRGDLFVSHNLIAEVKYLQALGLRPPARWFDTMLAWRYVTNATDRVPFGLYDALEARGIFHRFGAEKEELQKWIGELRFDPDSLEDRTRILDYCREDVRTTTLLYQALRQRVPAKWMAYLTGYALAVARMETRGIKINTAALKKIHENREAIVRQLTAEVNAVAPVLDGGQVRKGELLKWCVANGIPWPFKTPTGGPRFDDKAWKIARDWHPFLAEVSGVRHTAGQLLDRTVLVDPADGRHYFGCIPLAQESGRSSPKGCLLGAAKWWRWLLTPTDREHALINIDYKGEEIGLAAYFSGDSAMMAGYSGPDYYLDFAARAGLAPEGATKDTHGDVRARCKIACLGINYGQSAYGLARSLRVDQAVAQRLIDQHKRIYPRYWAWRERYLIRAHRLGRCWTRAGWPLRVPAGSNPRTTANFPAQGSGADLLRETVLRIEEHGLTLLATNHDSFLLEVRKADLADARAELDTILQGAVDALLPGCPLRWEVATYRTRYEDPDGKKMRERIKGILAGVKGGVGMANS
jgi:DNA polymerase I-like protein with 3'-5' exonuclease and polymerase domains